MTLNSIEGQRSQLTKHPPRWENTTMHQRPSFFALLALLILLIPGLGASWPMQAKPVQERVILRVNRNLVVKGYLELEDDMVMVVRDLKGDIQSFSKTKVQQIIRLVVPQPDQRGVIYMNSGHAQEAIIIEDAFDKVVFEVDGIRSELRRGLVNYVMLEPSFQDQYEHFKKQLEPGMHARHFYLCEWLFKKEKYELAKQELDLLLSETNLDKAHRLLVYVNAQLALNRDSGNTRDDDKTPDERENADADSGKGLIPTSKLLPQQLLTQKDVNLIRVMEIDFSAPPKISIKPETVRMLIANYREDRRIPITPEGQARLFRVAAERPLDLLRLMFEMRTRELYSEVEVLTEPRALNLFRLRVHNAWLINNCATRRCHGGPNAGRFFLHRKGYKDERVRYTNLLILDRLELDPDWPLINYQEPNQSLIIQHALPRESARKPHPDVRGFKPVFTSGNRKLLANTISWIQAMMHDPRPEYPVDFEPAMINTTTSDDAPNRP
ncbi:MAG: hypothetical protein O7G85_04205, partial [Planctomycetota bacterium]|nr:hypothetical protein [Planctomycetota bacterium]